MSSQDKMSLDNWVLAEFREIFLGVDNEEVRKALHYIESCYNPNTPTHEISRMGVMTAILNLNTYFSDRKAFFDKTKPLIEKVDEHLAELGYRVDITTYQEHKIIGSTQWSEYAKEPHKPIGVIKEELTVEEADNARKLARRQGALGYYFVSDNDFIQISLDANGNTIRDPLVLDDDLNPIPTTYSPDFPFRREYLQ